MSSISLQPNKHTTYLRTASAILTIAAIAMVFAAVAEGAHAQTYTVLYNFSSKSGDPTCPHYSGLIAQGRDGNLYSSAEDCWTDGLGTAFKITPAGRVTVLHHFSGPEGQASTSGLTLGPGGNYYGTTEFGGLYSHGTIYKITAAGAVTSLYSFTGGVDGGQPVAPPILGFDGNFYGITCVGGSSGNTGTVYKITPSGVFTTLHSFGYTTSNPGDYNSPLVQGIDGYLYGVTAYGGTFDRGTIFRVSSSGNFRTLFTFDGSQGSYPGELLQGVDGNFYGVSSRDGSAGGGVAFKITTTGTFSVLHDFTGGSDGWNETGLMQATDGNLYGTNNLGGGAGWGVLFRINPTTGTFTVLHDFDWDTGASPQADLLQHTSGVLYSTTKVGGVGNSGDGTFYSFDLGLGPFVRLLPNALAVGRKVGVLGQGFTGTTAVSFNGTPALFTVVADTYLTATVPEGGSTGFVTVTTPSGTLTSNKKFQVR